MLALMVLIFVVAVPRLALAYIWYAPTLALNTSSVPLPPELDQAVPFDQNIPVTVVNLLVVKLLLTVTPVLATVMAIADDVVPPAKNLIVLPIVAVPIARLPPL